MCEPRLSAPKQMSGMNADPFFYGSRRLIVTGPRALRGEPLDGRDVRSGMALAAAALVAEGESRIDLPETVERGCVRFVDRRRALGASVCAA